MMFVSELETSSPFLEEFLRFFAQCVRLTFTAISLQFLHQIPRLHNIFQEHTKMTIWGREKRERRALGETLSHYILFSSSSLSLVYIVVVVIIFHGTI